MVKSHPKLALALIAFVLYAPTLFFGYVYMDDYLMVQEAAFYSKIENIPKSFNRSVWTSNDTDYNYYRPASTSVYILGAWASTLISNDISPWIFHLTNILLQMAASVLLFSMLLELGASMGAAFAAALIWTAHPVNAGTVGWIPGQNELLLAIAVTGGFLSYLRALRGPRWFWLHGLCFLLAVLTKENGIGLPLLCAMHLAFSVERRRLSLWLMSFLAWGATIAVWILMAQQGGVRTPAAGSALQGMWLGLPYLLIYLGQLFMPVGLSTLPTAQDAAGQFWIAGAGGALLTLGIAAWRFRQRPMALIGLCWFGGFLLPTFAGLLPEMKQTFILRSDRSYLASIGILIVFLQIPEASWRELFVKKPARIALGLTVAAALALNLEHQFHFSTGMAFYTSAVEGSPRSSFAHTHLGDMHLHAKDIAGAIQQYKAAIELNDHEPQVHNNLGVAYMRAGDTEKAAAEYVKELQFHPKNALAWSNLGSIYLQKGDHAQAENAFRKAVEINPAYKDAWHSLYQIYDLQKRIDKREEAKRNLEAAEMDMSRGI